MTRNRRIYGVDFSGSQNAGDKIWLASATTVGTRLFVEGCYPARELPNSARGREQCYAAIAEFVATRTNAAFGFDFPFGIPAEVTEYENWETFVADFDEVYEDLHDFYETCKERGSNLRGDGVEYKRDTDLNADAPFCPYNLRMRYQTYYGIGDLLRRLVDEDRVRALPMQSADETYPWVLEVCPSSTLKDQFLPRTGYKGSTENNEQVRCEIIEGLEDTGVTLNSHVRQIAIDETEGDALDSIVAAVATAKAIRDRPEVGSVGVEGYIYV